ncbi:hypothetical protein CFC21_026396 [Triticum aestivum]|uniref:DUF4220 domain-containing protein n=2 Tax=Triticum aestivum TaxID=4565 RepID=A0A3B6CG75_WHEAT|nr:hypothetical protein CFC21_026396 [Triticum aestivum]
MAQWWWEGRELRILVLASLSAQYFLVLFAGVRKFHIPPWLRVSFRLAHIGSDALAIFTLATLFSRQKNGPSCSYARGSHSLELLWAPIVLMHLGGQVVITTYKIEDNEQWSRHILTSLSKVVVALYVFYKSWSSNDKSLLAATILLFFMVIIRCFQKALDLKSSSFNALRKASSSGISIIRGTYVTEKRRLDKFIKKARKVVHRDGPRGSPADLPRLPYQLFLDFPCLYSDRVGILNFWLLDPKSAYQAIERALSAMTSFLYTKDDTVKPYLGSKEASATAVFRRCTQILAYATLIVAICLVQTSSQKKDYNSEDTWVTLVLLWGTFVLELVYLGVQTAFRDRFSGRVLQHSLIGLLAHNRRHSRLRTIAGWLQCKDFLDDCWHMKPIYSCEEITELVRQHVESLWKHCILDNETYSWHNDTRGEWTLTSKRCLGELGWSIRRPFDESIILWHLATDLCFQAIDLMFHGEVTSPDDRECARRCREMSNYMMHLLFDNPEMLMPGSRKSLFTRAYQELEDMLRYEEEARLNEDQITLLVFERCHRGITGDALRLAESLLVDAYHGDATRMWKVIQGVWVEMLCFSAGRCRGYLHAETLGTGVEYLSYVWVLLAHAGMETFPEKLQREGLSVEGDDRV